MKVAIVRATYGQVREVKPTTSKQLWYDQEAEWLISVTCGKLAFSSDAKGKTKVKVADATKITYQTRSDHERIMNWYSRNSGDFSLEMVEGETGVLSFAFPDEMQNDVEDALSDGRFDYEIL